MDKHPLHAIFQGIPLPSAAKKLGISANWLCIILSGKGRPGADLEQKLIKLTRMELRKRLEMLENIGN